MNDIDGTPLILLNAEEANMAITCLDLCDADSEAAMNLRQKLVEFVVECGWPA